MTEKEIQQAAMGRMGYGLRALVSGWRVAGEDLSTIVQVLLNESINLSITIAGGTLLGGRQILSDVLSEAWTVVTKNNPHLTGGGGGN